MIIRPVVDIARCGYCPDRHDYGLRYLQDDLPEEVWTLVPLAYPKEVSEIPVLARQADAMFEELLALTR